MNWKYGIALAGVLVLTACGGESENASPGDNNSTSNNVSANNANNVNSGNNANNLNNANNVDEAPTYWEDVSPIVEGRCSNCHVEGGIGPFELQDYEDAKPLANLMASVVEDRTMPPFQPGKECNEFKHDPSLSDEQIKTIADWAAAGAPEGDEASKGEALPDVGSSGISRVDHRLRIPVEYTPRSSPDDYRCFMIDWDLEETSYITGFGVDPDQDEIVHHLIAFYVPPSLVEEAERVDAAEEGPGWSCFGAPGVGDPMDTRWLGSWAPGGTPSDFPEGTGLKVEPGSKIVVQMHYNTLTAEPRPDQSEVLLKVDTEVEKEAEFLIWADPRWLSGSMEIPAGDAGVRHSFAFDPTRFYSDGRAIKFYGGFLHMHLLGQSARTIIARSTGEEDCMIDIPNYDFNWQGGVNFKEPMVLNPGDRLKLECTWDNTMENQPVIDGERVAPEDQNWGDGTRDEMCLGVFYVTYE